jgi:NAD(P)-dependent dehydrogenase (short-subunit alcohol dehydrogenase family)
VEEIGMLKLADKVAVITGATSGMALAAAKALAAEGAHVYITGRRSEMLERAAEEIGRNVTPVQADSGDLAALDHLAETVRRGHGRVDVLYSSAGYGGGGQPLGEVTVEAYDKIFGVNVRGTVFTAQALLPLMSEGASIILNGSGGSVKGLPGLGLYSASKAALRSLARTWAAELAPRGIRVNVIIPGPIDTALFEHSSAEAKNRYAAAVPLGRLGRPEEIGKAVLFLASSDASFVTGTAMYVDGGYTQV